MLKLISMLLDESGSLKNKYMLLLVVAAMIALLAYCFFAEKYSWF